MTKFDEKDRYEITIDKEKNRMNLLFLGHWASPEDVPNYVDHVKEGIGMLKKGFTIYAEIMDKKPPSLKVNRIHKQGQLAMKEGGVRKTAVVLDKGRILQKMALNVISRFSGFDIKIFNEKQEALKWLEEK